MRGIFAKANIRNHKQRGILLFDMANGSLCDAVRSIRLRADRILFLGNPENQHACNAACRHLCEHFIHAVNGILEHARHRRNRIFDILPFYHKNGVNHLLCGNSGFAHQPSHGFCAAQSSESSHLSVSFSVVFVLLASSKITSMMPSALKVCAVKTGKSP